MQLHNWRVAPVLDTASHGKLIVTRLGFRIACSLFVLCLLSAISVRQAAAEQSHARFLYPIAVQKTAEVPAIVLDVSEVSDSPNTVKWAEDS